MGGAWVLEVGEYLLVALVFLPAAWIMRNEGHVALDMLYEAVGSRTKRAFLIIGGIASTVIVGIVAYYAIAVVIDLSARDIILRKLLSIPRAWVIAPIAVGTTLLALRIAVMTTRVLITREPGLGTPDSEPPAATGG